MKTLFTLRTAVWASLVGLSLMTGMAQAADITGSVNLAPALRSKVGSDAVLYVIARQGDTAGPPVAVKRITQPFHFPVPFAIGPSDLMMNPGELSGKYSLTARISQNGSAMPKAGDLQTLKQKEGVAAGGPKVKLTIDSVKN
jgi:cytochrome c-type biogenesis protein CcmH